MTDRVDSQIHENKEYRVKPDKSEGAQGWLRQPIPQVDSSLRRILEDIPTVQPNEASHIHPGTAEGRDSEDEDPSDRPIEFPLDDLLHEGQRDDSQQHARPRDPNQ